MGAPLVARRVKGIPVTFRAVVVVTVLLTVYLGAWAVSADVEAQNRSLAPAVGGGAGFAVLGPSSEGGEAVPSKEGDSTASDAWWGKALLTACPLH